jgi:membrane-associated phospholipid phosphatase
MKLFAKVINVILHPVALTLPGVFLIVFQSTKDTNEAFLWTFFSVIFSGIVSLFVLYGVKKGFFNNLDVSNRKQRIILYPFIIAVVILFIGFVYLMHGPSSLIKASVLIIAALLILDIINTKIKVSGHVAVVSSLVTGLVYAYGGAVFISILLIPLIAWARITEKRHTLKETVVGALCGIVLSLTAIYIVQFL